MKIVLFHPVALPPKDYGGVERVVEWLARGLIERGHSVWVGALRGSRVPRGCQLIEFDAEQRSAWDLVSKLPPHVEMVHFMAPPEPGVMDALRERGISSLLTIHGNGKPGEVFPINTVFLTRNHAERHGRSEFVYNGLDPDEFVFDPKAVRTRWAFLSKTQWRVKNLRGAIRLANRAHANLDIAGGWRPHTLRWMVQWKHLFGGRHRWIGPVNSAEKALFLSQAKGLLFPVLWDEPFGLVVVEALLSGAPVLATPRGSLPELVTSNVGKLIALGDAHLEEWVEWLSKPKLPFDPAECREHAMRKFHFRNMAEAYEQAYRRVITWP
jgi:glycosyltransferase involved in cell wall biosynthesis